MAGVGATQRARERAPHSLQTCSGRGSAVRVRHIGQYLLYELAGAEKGGWLLGVRRLDDERTSIAHVTQRRTARGNTGVG